MRTVAKNFKSRLIKSSLKAVNLKLQLGPLKLTPSPVDLNAARRRYNILALFINHAVSPQAQAWLS